VCMVSKRTSIRSVAKSCLCKEFIKKTCKWRHDYTTRFSKGEPENEQCNVGMFEYLVIPTRRGKCHSQHIPSHQEE